MPVVDIYRIQFKDVESVDVQILIYDLAGPPEPGYDFQFIDLVAAEDDPLVISKGSDEKIHSPIIGMVATMKFQNTSSTFLSLFSGGEDNRFEVGISYGGSLTPIFKGFLVQEDNMEPYLPPGQVVTLTATDNLGLLKGKELTKIDGTKFSGENKIKDFVIACLYQTGLNILTNVVINLYEDSHETRTAGTNRCPWNQTHINAGTFKKSDGDFIDSYTVLTDILESWGCRCAYNRGRWWIVRIDEYINTFVYYSTYDAQGVLLTDGTLDASLLKVMDHETRQPVFFINEASLVRLQRANKYAQKEYLYEMQDDIPCNKDFERGDVIDDVLPLKTFEIDCWTLKNHLPESGSPTCEAFIQRRYDAGERETERYAVLSIPSVAPSFEYIESEPIPLGIKDKFDFSVDFAWDDDNLVGGPLTVTIAMILLEGDAGAFYTLDNNGKWYLSNSTYSVNRKLLQYTWDTTLINEEDWRTLSIDTEPVPVSGNIKILLFAMNQQVSTVDNAEIHYQNLKFDYIPLIDGSYKDFKSERYKVSQDGNLSANVEGELSLSDSSKKLFKGSMKTLSGSIYSLTTLWNDWAAAQHGITGLTNGNFAKWQTYNTWNQFRTSKRIFDVQLKGLDTDTADYCDIIHKWRNDVYSFHNRNKFFLFLHIEQNWKTGQWSGTMIEIQDLAEERNYTDTFVFKYIAK